MAPLFRIGTRGQSSSHGTRKGFRPAEGFKSAEGSGSAEGFRSAEGSGSAGGSISAEGSADIAKVARAIEKACRQSGFFYVKGHGISKNTLTQLEKLSHQFFALPESAKMEISMDKGGRAWRGYFPVGGELTSGKADQKEGLYFGSELDNADPRVQAGLPLHGANLWPTQIKGLRQSVADYMTQTASVAQVLLQGIALSLGLEYNYFQRFYTDDPTVLFRIFHYPAVDPELSDCWGVGEHTDYGLLTLLAQDHHGGLQVKSGGHWIDAPPLDNMLVCNIGDMLDRLTAGWYVSTAHRVLAQTESGRLSFPLFFDPDFSAEMRPLPLVGKAANDVGDPVERWDEADLHCFEGSYGKYLLSKVSKVFPQLVTEVL